MTKKDYILIAKAVKEARDDVQNAPHNEKYIVSTVAFALARELEKDNSRFDRQKFIEACGIEA